MSYLMTYEKEQERLLKLMAEVITDEEYDDEESAEEDRVVEQLDNSDTEQEIDSDEDQTEESTISNSSSGVYIGKDCRTTWKKHAPPRNVRTRNENITIHLPGPKNNLQNRSIVEIWSSFFDDEMLEEIVKNTNLKIESVKENYMRERDIRPTNLVEIKALIGLLYLAGVRKANHLNTRDLWRSDGTGIESFRLTMSINRFLTLLRFIRFDNVETRIDRIKTDKLAAIRTLFDKFNNKLRENYSHSDYVTVDEKLEGFRGKCNFRQYIPSKPNKYGIKIFALCDAKMYYTSCMEVYVGVQPEGPYRVDNSAKCVVERLCSHIYKTNRNVTTDNWFTSIALAESLRLKRLTLVGTIRKNKREIPKIFSEGKTHPVGTSMFGFGCGGTLVSYIPKKNRNVLLFSTMHKGDIVNPTTGKPEMIHFYNDTKGGVDMVDKLCSSYNVARCTRRWPMVIFYSMLNVAGINAFIITASKPEYTKTRRNFLVDVSAALVYQHQKNRAMLSNLPQSLKVRLREITDTRDNGGGTMPNTGSIGRCSVCGWRKNRKTKYFCRVCGKFLCLEHVRAICENCVG